MRFELVQPESLQVRESMGLVKDIYDPIARVREPLSEYRTMLDLIRNDNTLSTAYDIIVEFATHRGFDFIGGNKKERDKLRLLFEDLNWEQVQTNLIYSLFYYGDAFLELRRNNSKTPNELWVLETTEMRIAYDGHGKVEGYVQRPFKMTGMSQEKIIEKEREIVPKSDGGDGIKTQGVFFEPDEVIHFRMKWIGSQVYSYNPNEPIATEAATKRYAGNYLMNIFINMPPRHMVHLAGISKRDYKSAVRDFQSAKTNYKKAIAFTRSSDPKAKLQMQKIEPPYDEQLIKVMKWINKEMLKITRVPKTWVEGEESENRGVGESLNLPFQVRIQYLHRNIIEPQINKKLLRALGHFKKPVNTAKRMKLRYNEISRKGELEILQNVGLLRDMGLKVEAMVRMLDERGILGFDPTDFEERQVKKNIELNDSRQRMNKDTKDMTQNRNEAGVSNKSAQKMKI